LACETATIGFNPAADYHVTYDRASRRVGINFNGDPGDAKGRSAHLANWTIAQPGEHMAMNSAMAFVLALWLGADPDAVAEALTGFRGVDRRLQLLASCAPTPGEPPIRVFDDYGHHPTEIDTTLRALREAELTAAHPGPDPGAGDAERRPPGRLICVFQPHQHSRTRFLLDEFAESFAHADVVIVPHIYFVRDSELEKTRVSSADLVDRLRARGVRAMHLYPFEAIVEQLEGLVRPGDLVVTMGAGPVWRIAHAYLKLLERTPGEDAG
jgi:UDP-N-acetylmuramate--alanine ligase